MLYMLAGAALGSALLFLRAGAAGSDAWQPGGQLRFKDGKFKVVQLTDLHLGEGMASNAATRQVRAMPCLAKPLPPLPHPSLASMVPTSMRQIG